jgi:hypothetical protein
MLHYQRILTAALVLTLLSAVSAHADSVTINGAAIRAVPFHEAYADNPVIPGESATTGLPFAGPYVPILLVFDNAQKARPLVGVAQADVVFQMPNAGAGATKLIGLFADNVPTQAGNVRSVRVPFIELREIYGAALVYAGGPTSGVSDAIDIKRRLKEFGVYDQGLSFNIIGAQQAYESSLEGKDTSHNSMANLAEIRDLLLSEGKQFAEVPFRFTDALPLGGEAATDIEIAHFASKTADDEGNPASWARYLYDADSNAYARMVDTGVFADYGDPDTALTYKNLIVLRVNYKFLGNYVLLPEFTGHGMAEIFIGGRYIAGGWVRETLQSRIVLVDESGNEIALQRGNTFIVVGNQATRVTFSAGD